MLINRSFRNIWIGQTLSVLGDSIFSVGYFWSAYKITASATEASTIILASTIPYLLFGLLGGAYSDRLDRKKLMLVCDLGRALLLLPMLLVLTIAGQTLPIWLLGATGFSLTSFRCFFHPALKASIPSVVPGNLLQKASAIIHGSFQSVSIVGAAIGGVILSSFSLGSIVAVNILSFLVSFIFVYLTDIKSPEKKTFTPIFSGIKDSFKTAMREPLIRFVILLFPIGLTCIIGLNRLAGPILSDLVWNTGPKGFGILLGMVGFGNVLGSIFLGFKKFDNSPALIFTGWIIWGISYSIIGLTPSIYVSLAFALCVGVAQSLVDIPFVAHVQRKVDKEELGRVFSIWSTMAYIGESASNSFVGLLMISFSASATFVLGGILCAVFSVLFLFLYQLNVKPFRFHLKVPV